MGRGRPAPEADFLSLCEGCNEGHSENGWMRLDGTWLETGAMWSNTPSVQRTGREPPTGTPSARPGREQPDEGGRIFTAHVRQLAAAGGSDRRGVEEVWAALRAALRSELRKRGLWEGPPAYLGVFGGDSWEGSGGGTPLEELLVDCYAFVFLDRLRSLRAQLAVKDNVDGLVFLNIRHFLHERQREHDPLGFRVFEVLRGAVQGALAAGELHLLAGDPRVRNDSRLGFAADAAPETAPAAVDRLHAAAAGWAGDLLPDLVTARGKEIDGVAGRLRALLPELRAGGVAAFSFKDLVDPFKAEVRARWAALLAADDPGAPEAAAPSRHDLLAEGREGFRKLVLCVQGMLDRLDAAEATLVYLRKLWQFVRIWASSNEQPAPTVDPAADLLDHPPSQPTSEPASILPPDATDDELPSQRRLAEHLRIPRERLPGLFGTLGRIVARCQAAAGWKTAVTDLDESTRQRSSRGGGAA